MDFFVFWEHSQCPWRITYFGGYKAEVEQFYEDLQDLLELTPKKDVLCILGDWNAK